MLHRPLDVASGCPRKKNLRERLHGRRFFFKMTQDFIPLARMISDTAHYFEKIKGYLESLIQNERFRVVWFY